LNHVAPYAQWTGYVTWFCLAWAALTKVAAIADRAISESRRWRNARRFTTWRPAPRARDTGEDVTRVYPGIQRPKGPRR
jgi:hypothetical protein